MALPNPTATRTAVVTGASAGIGAEIARGLAERGHDVVLVARRLERLTELASQLTQAHDVTVRPIAADLATTSGRDDLAARISELDLGVSVLVNNAGFGTFNDIANADRKTEANMVRLNCEAVADLTTRYLPGMVKRGEGAVINIASAAAFQPLPGQAGYGATKAFVLSYSEAAHAEVAAAGVTVTCVCPGPVRTEFAEVAGVGEQEDRVPDFMWMTAAEVAAQSLAAAEKGKRVHSPGLGVRVGAVAGRFAPRTIALPLLRRAYKSAGLD